MGDTDMSSASDDEGASPPPLLPPIHPLAPARRPPPPPAAAQNNHASPLSSHGRSKVAASLGWKMGSESGGGGGGSEWQDGGAGGGSKAGASMVARPGRFGGLPTSKRKKVGLGREEGGAGGGRGVVGAWEAVAAGVAAGKPVMAFDSAVATDAKGKKSSSSSPKAAASPKVPSTKRRKVDAANAATAGSIGGPLSAVAGATAAGSEVGTAPANDTANLSAAATTGPAQQAAPAKKKVSRPRLPTTKLPKSPNTTTLTHPAPSTTETTNPSSSSRKTASSASQKKSATSTAHAAASSNRPPPPPHVPSSTAAFRHYGAPHNANPTLDGTATTTTAAPAPTTAKQPTAKQAAQYAPSPSPVVSDSQAAIASEATAALVHTSKHLAYSWDPLRLGTQLGSAALNQYLSQINAGRAISHELLSPQQALQVVSTLRTRTCLPPATSELHSVVQKNEGNESYSSEYPVTTDDASVAPDLAPTVLDSPTPLTPTRPLENSGAPTPTVEEDVTSPPRLQKSTGLSLTSPSTAQSPIPPSTATARGTTEPAGREDESEDAAPEATTVTAPGSTTGESSSSARASAAAGSWTSLPLFRSLSRLYETMCAQDADDGSSSKRESHYLTATACVDRLRSLENRACLLKIQEDQVLARSKALGLYPTPQQLAPFFGYSVSSTAATAPPPPAQQNADPMTVDKEEEEAEEVEPRSIHQPATVAALRMPPFGELTPL